MRENDKPVLIYSTFPDAVLAETAGRALVEQSLCACVNILPAMTSIYRWEGAVETASEAVLIIKTRTGLVPDVMAAVSAIHPYELPAFVVLAVEGGLAPYLDWIVSSTRD